VNLCLDIQRASGTAGTPDDASFERWVRAALAGRRAEAELSLRLVDEAEMTELNGTYRDRHYATNVLSFPADLPPELQLPLLGDIAICAPVVEREAAEQGKPAEAHWAHMVVHGTLHLLGYDHIEDDEAAVMEALERAVLAALAYPDPYNDTQTEEGTRSHG
jgi:probable rRNA maturation factor